MAYQASYLTEDEKNAQNTQNVQSLPGGIATSGVTDAYTSTAGASGGTPGGNPGANTAAPAKTPGTGFVNLQQYLDTNKDEGARMAGAATKGLTDQAQAFKDTTADTVKTATTDYTKAAGGDTAEALTTGVQNGASTVQQQAKDFLGAGFTGRAANDYTAGLAADQQQLSASLGTVDKAENVQSALADTYGKQGNYTQGFGTLDQFLVGGTEGGRNKLADVKKEAKNVNAAYDGARWTLNNAEKAARDALKANQQKVKTAAATARQSALSPAQAALDAQNRALDLNRSGAKLGGLGNRITDSKARLDIDALNAILGRQGENWAETYNAGSDPEPAVSVQQGKASSGSGIAPWVTAPGNAAAKAGKDISTESKKITNPQVGVLKALGKAVATPSAKNIGTAVAEIPKGAIGSAAGSMEVGQDIAHQILSKVGIPSLPAPSAPKLKKPKW